MSKHTVTIRGQVWHQFSCEYRHDDRAYCFEIWATDQADADRRMRSIRGNAEVSGQLEGVIECRPATAPVVGLWVRFKCWFRNLL